MEVECASQAGVSLWLEVFMECLNPHSELLAKSIFNNQVITQLGLPSIHLGSSMFPLAPHVSFCRREPQPAGVGLTGQCPTCPGQPSCSWGVGRRSGCGINSGISSGELLSNCVPWASSYVPREGHKIT